MDQSDSKACSKCNEQKSLAEFSKSGSKWGSGLRNICKTCASLARRAYYEANREKAVANSVAFYAANADEVKAAKAAYYKAHPEKRRAVTAKHYRLHQEKLKAKSVAWKGKNPDRRKIHRQARRARVSGTEGRLSSGLAAKLFKLQRGKCPCCNQPLGDDYHLDHILPLSRGGKNVDSNIQLLRARCNAQKHAKHPLVFMRERGFLL